MRSKDYLLVFIVGFLVVLGVAFLQSVPGYMDAAYYYAGGVQLVRGLGFNEQFLWNYLDDPKGIPHPSHTYWMPLASIVAAGGMFLAGSEDFLSARVFFILIASLVPPVSMLLAFLLTRDRKKAILTGWWGIFSGFYLIYISNTDSFGLYMGLGTLFLILAFAQRVNALPIGEGVRFGGLGILSGLMHLTRADGILWFGAALFLVVWFTLLSSEYRAEGGGKKHLLTTGVFGVCVIVGYLAVMFPWYWRNMKLYGHPFSPAGNRVLWLTHYDQMFSYPAQNVLNIANWLSVSMVEHLRTRWFALIVNLKTALAVQGEIFLAPLILLGAWKLRRHKIVQFAWGMWLLTLFLMTVVFPLAGQRGGFLHSGAALQPFLWAMSAVGFETAILYAARRRRWSPDSAIRILGIGLIFIGAILSSFLVLQRVIGADVAHPSWRASWDRAIELEDMLEELGAQPSDIVIVNNPPEYFLATGRGSIVLPYGNEDTLFSLAVRYHARYLMIDENSPEGLRFLYENPQDSQRMDYLASLKDTRIYRIRLESN